jgi:hypothetical protein
MFTAHAKANFPGMPNYSPSEPRVELKYFDVTSLYPTVMCKKLPHKSYTDIELFASPMMNIDLVHGILNDYTPYSDDGYAITVTAHIPDRLHDQIDFAPVSRRIVQLEELNARQREIKRRRDKVTKQHDLKNKTAMLVPWLGEHREVMWEVGHLKFLRDELGLVITHVHAITKYSQSYWLRDYILRCATERRTAKNQVASEVWKLIMNALYGKFLQDKSKYRSTFIYTDHKKFLLSTWRESFKDCEIYNNLVEDDGFLATVTLNQCGRAVHDTPRIQGWAILEHTKHYRLFVHYRIFKASRTPTA